jgi:hypothetical protein
MRNAQKTQSINGCSIALQIQCNMIPESLLQFIWKNQLFSSKQLRLAGGDPLEVLHTGTLNNHAGPDFQEARIRVNGTLWAGNIEVHVKASDWKRHKHHTDPAYRNVVLHVVWEDDERILDPSGNALPVFDLKHYVSLPVLETYRQLELASQPIACRGEPYSENAHTRAWLDRMLVERLQSRSPEIQRILERCRFDWEEAAYVYLGRAFGFRVNADPFQQLALSVPLKVVQQCKSSVFKLEALFLGQSGLVDESVQDEYPRALYSEYRYLQKVYRLKSMERHVWKKARMRPMNFPTIRIVQFAHVLGGKIDFRAMLEEPPHTERFMQWLDVQPSAYWNTHFSPDQPSVALEKHLGREAQYRILVNAIAPFLLCFAQSRAQEHLREQVLDLFESLPAEDNRDLRQWKAWGITPQNAAEAQSLIGLFRSYCEKGRCLECGLGWQLLRNAR